MRMDNKFSNNRALLNIKVEGFSFREALPGDCKQISVVEKNAQPAPWSEEVFRNEFNVKVSNIWVALEADRILGFLVFWIVVDELHVLNVAVHDLARRRGLASSMIQALKDEARRTQKTLISLEVRESNIGAQKLYAGLGFQTLARRKAYYADTKEDAIVLACIIEESS